MYYGEKKIDKPIRWAMVGGGKGSQIGYIHRSAALRDFNFDLVAGAFDIDPERGKAFGRELHVAEDRCYPDVDLMRKKAAISLDEAMLYSLKYTIKDLAEKAKPIHIDTVECYNDILENFKEKDLDI